MILTLGHSGRPLASENWSYSSAKAAKHTNSSQDRSVFHVMTMTSHGSRLQERELFMLSQLYILKFAPV
jgi:hypothetical protein